MKSKEWTIVIGVVLVVAIAASLITANITGNTIKAARGFGPNAKEVYTKQEIDNKLNNLNSIDSSLDSLTVRSVSNDDGFLLNSPLADMTCEDICKLTEWTSTNKPITREGELVGSQKCLFGTTSQLVEYKKDHFSMDTLQISEHFCYELTMKEYILKNNIAMLSCFCA